MAEENGVVAEGGVAGASTDMGNTADVGGSSAEVNWSDMALEMDQGDDMSEGDVEGDVEVVAAPESAEPPAEPQAPVAPPMEQQATPPVAPQAQPQVVPSQQIPATQPQEPPAQPNVTYEEWRGQQLSALEKHYAFDEQTSAQLLTEPEVVLPKLAAKLHMDVTEQVMRTVMAQVPQWVQSVNAVSAREAEAKSLFEKVNPDLADPAYHKAILQMGQAYRAMNPSAPAEEAAKVIGNMVRSALGLAMPQQQQALPQRQVAPSAPVAPFTPARGGGGAAAQPQVSSNPWAQLAEEFLTE